MSAAWRDLDVNLPEVTGDTSPVEMCQQLFTYVQLLTRHLRHTLSHLDRNNFTAAEREAYEQLQMALGCEGNTVRIGVKNGRVELVGEVYINGVRLEVTQ